MVAVNRGRPLGAVDEGRPGDDAERGDAVHDCEFLWLTDEGEFGCQTLPPQILDVRATGTDARPGVRLIVQVSLYAYDSQGMSDQWMNSMIALSAML